ncbi:unnamed protein product [Lepeophtheirus salmonis]|nr:unnamed protein product [Lepeophtheirus salmonis]CAF2818815.1 unnamed protein product [Lepeophtheirus salmonis]
MLGTDLPIYDMKNLWERDDQKEEAEDSPSARRVERYLNCWIEDDMEAINYVESPIGLTLYGRLRWVAKVVVDFMNAASIHLELASIGTSMSNAFFIVPMQLQVEIGRIQAVETVISLDKQLQVLQSLDSGLHSKLRTIDFILTIP